MLGVSFELPFESAEDLFELYWGSLKRSVSHRNALPPRAAVLISKQRIELVNIHELGGFTNLGRFILNREQDESCPLEAFIVSFELIDKDTCDGKLVAILFPKQARPPIAKLATWLLVGEKIFCEDSSSGFFADYDFEDLIGLLSPQVGFA